MENTEFVNLKVIKWTSLKSDMQKEKLIQCELTVNDLYVTKERPK